MFGVMLAVGLAVSGTGTEELKRGWGRFSAATPVKGALEVRTLVREGSGAKAVERNGKAFAWVEDGPEGLKLSWSRAQVRALDGERRLQDQQPDAFTPQLEGLGLLKMVDVVDQVNMIPELLRALEKGVLKADRREAYQGRPARLLVFEVPLERAGVPERIRKRFKEFSALANLWVGDDGTPLGFQRTVTFKGRFLVVPFSGSIEEKGVFGVVGDRLVLSRFESLRSQSGAGEESRTEVARIFSPR